jgi:hypothetical protein
MSKRTRDDDRLENWPAYLRGETHNRWGGHKVQKLRGYSGNTYGAASACKTYTAEQRAAWAKANGYKC